MHAIKEILGERVANLRAQRGISQTKLADTSDTALNTIKTIEKGCANPSITTLAQIASALGVAPADLLLSDEAQENRQHQNSVANSMYPPPLPSYCGSINNMLALVTYLPLISPLDLSDALLRVGGDLIGREAYLVSLFTRAVAQIPDCPARRYADMIANRIIEMQKQLNEGENIDNLMCDFMMEEDVPAEYEAYIHALERYASLAKALQMIREVSTDTP